MSGYIDNYGTAGNPVLDISGTPLNVVLNFEDKGAFAPTDHALQAFSTLVNLPPSLEGLLQIPLNQIADQAWAQDQDSAGKTMRDRTAELIRGQIPAAVNGLGSSYSAYNVAVNLPATGIVRAIVLSDALTNPNASQIVFLSYEVFGISASFAATTPFTGGLISDPTYNLTFDIELLIQIVVPHFASPFTTVASFNVENANISGSNRTADVGDAIKSALNFFTDQPTNIFQADPTSE